MSERMFSKVGLIISDSD